jgi:hypothetical protein
MSKEQEVELLLNWEDDIIEAIIDDDYLIFVFNKIASLLNLC